MGPHNLPVRSVELRSPHILQKRKTLSTALAQTITETAVDESKPGTEGLTSR